jgi:ubiquinone/menaquinone biosynthesis C-methylase UbiE
LWSQRFGKLLLRELALPPKAMVLDVGCGTGHTSLEILRRLEDQGRIIAIDSSSSMLDEARRKAGVLSGKRIFFRSENALPRLSFAQDVYDLVVCNAVLQEFEDPEVGIREFVRVCKPGGRVVVTLPLAGTYQEFFDILREVLVKHDQQQAIDRLDAYLVRYPPLEQAQAWFEDAGCSDVQAECESYTLLFKSAREFFFAPIIEYGPLTDWKSIAGKGSQMQEIFWEAKASIDAYFGKSSFAVTVMAGCVKARKQRPDERPVIDLDAEGADAIIDANDDVTTNEVERATGEVQLSTGEIELVDDDSE